MSMKYLGTILLLTLVAFSGCSRYIDSRNPVRSLPESGQVPANLTAGMIDGGVRLTWTIDDAAAVQKYRIYAAKEVTGTPLNYVVRDSSTTTTVDITDLQMNQRYSFEVAAVLTSGLEWEPSEAVSAEVTYLSISIKDGAEYANDRNVLVNINAPLTTSHIELSEDSTFAGSSFVPFSGTAKQFELSEGDGVKWVYAKLQFEDGSTTAGFLRDSIILDTRAAIDSVFFVAPVSGQYFTSGQTIQFGLDAGEIGGKASIGFTGVGQVKLYDDGSGVDPVAGDGVYWGTWTVPNSFTLNNGQVTGTFVDAAGNSAPQITAREPLNIFTAPLPVTVAATAISTYEIALTWTQAVGTNFAAYRIYRDASPTVSQASELITTITTGSTTSYTDTDLDAATTYYYRVYVYDNAGLSSGSEVVSATTEVNTVPDPVDLYAVVGSDTTTVQLSWTQSNETDFESYRIYRSTSPTVDTTATLVLLDRSIGTLTTTATLPGAPSGSNTRYYFRVFVFDRHGAMAGSNTVDVHAPEP